MNKRIYLLMTGFLVVGLGWGLGCNTSSEASQQVMHVSERVKIKRPEPPKAVQPPIVKEEETPAPAKMPAVKSEVAAIDQKPAEPGDLPSKPVASAETKPETESRDPETRQIDLAVPEAPEPGTSPDLIDEKQALFGDQEKYYVKNGRVDPFEPFLHKPEPKAVDIQTQEVQRRTPRTPLERVALGQLKLTAVMRLTAEQLNMAMVEDNNGKGYIVKKGTYIGENGGRVSDISENKVIVEEKYNDVFGKISVRQIELKLQKQPGE